MENRRKQKIIDKGYQGRIALKIISICSIYILLNLISFNYLAYERLESLRWKMHLPMKTIGEIIKGYLLLSTGLSLSLTIITLLIFIWYLFSKTSVPISKLKAYIDKLSDGDLSTGISLRRGDDFKDTANDCNKMVSAMRDKFIFIKSEFSKMERTLAKMEYVKDKPNIAREECKVLIETADSLRKWIKQVR